MPGCDSICFCNEIVFYTIRYKSKLSICSRLLMCSRTSGILWNCTGFMGSRTNLSKSKMALGAPFYITNIDIINYLVLVSISVAY